MGVLPSLILILLTHSHGILIPLTWCEAGSFTVGRYFTSLVTPLEQCNGTYFFATLSYFTQIYDRWSLWCSQIQLVFPCCVTKVRLVGREAGAYWSVWEEQWFLSLWFLFLSCDTHQIRRNQNVSEIDQKEKQSYARNKKTSRTLLLMWIY